MQKDIREDLIKTITSLTAEDFCKVITYVALMLPLSSEQAEQALQLFKSGIPVDQAIAIVSKEDAA